MKRPRLLATAVLFACAWLSLPSRADAAKTAKYFAIEDDNTTTCPHTDDRLTGAGKFSAAWLDKLVAKGWKDGGSLVDGDIGQALFCDPDDTAWIEPDPPGHLTCADASKGIDEADAVLVTLHGYDADGRWCGMLRYNSGARFCAACGGTDGWVHVGDADAEFFHLVSCHSMDDEDMPYKFQMLEDATDPGGSRGHILTGFHGNAHLNSSLKRRLKALAKDGFEGDVTSAWMDNLYDSSVGGSHREQCPISYAIGSSESDCEDHLLNDSYAVSDPDPSAATHYCYQYFEDCRPDDEGTFNPPED